MQETVTLMAKYFQKYSLLINQVDLAQVVDTGFLEMSVKWAVTELLSLFAERIPDLAESLKITELRAFLQICFSHVDHLITKLLGGKDGQPEA